MKYTCGPAGKEMELEINLPEGKNASILYGASGGADPAILLYILATRAPTNNYKRMILPFWHVTKAYTIDLYYKENIPELLELSHSCTERTVGRCNMCFQCIERNWAFTKLGKTDPGSK